MPIPAPVLPGGPSPVAYNGTGQPTIPAGAIVNGQQTSATPTPAASSANSNPHPNGVAGATGSTASAPYGVAPNGVPYASAAAASSNNGAITPPTTEPTAGQVYGGTGNPELDAATAAATAAAKAAAGQPDPNDPAVQAQIRAQTLAQFQAEIDSTNAIFAQKLAEAKIQGQGRLGSATATEARGGLLGSDFGAAQDKTVQQGNTDIENGITAEQQAAIASIMDKSNTAAESAIKDRTAARQAGLDNYVKYLQDASTRTQTNATAAANAVLAAKLDPTKMTADQLTQYLTNYGITQNDFNKAYAAAKPAYDQAQLDAAKKNQTVIAPGDKIIGADGKEVASSPAKPPANPTSVDEYNYAVTNSGYKGSYTDFLKMNANLKDPATIAANTKNAAGYTPAEQARINAFQKDLADPTLINGSKTTAPETREDFIRHLQTAYPDINADQISQAVYKAYPDKPAAAGGNWFTRLF